MVETVELVHAEALRLLEQQERELTTIRTRGAGILSAAGLINGLFGVKVAGKNDYSTGELATIWIAVVAFALMSACVIAIEWPRKYHFAEFLDDWLDSIKEGQPRRPGDYLFHYASQFTKFRDWNRPKVDTLYKLFTAACALLGVQVLGWGFSVILA